MAVDWPRTSLADLSSDVSYGYTESASTDRIGPKFLRITDIQGGRVEWSAVPYCRIQTSDHARYRLHEGDIVVARTGNSTGENFCYRGGEDAVFASYLIRFRVDPKKACARYVFYNLRSEQWWAYIRGSKTGSAQAGANAQVLGRFSMPLPPLPEQRAIASVLGALDDKIDLNRRMCQTLEEMARALFKSWFVDFDPVRAKMEGRDPGLPKEVADLFPSRLVDSELGLIPEGWRTGPIGTIVDCVGGATPSTAVPEYWNPPTHCWATPKDLSRLSTSVLRSTERQVSESGLANISSGLLPVGTVLMSSRAPVGYLAIAAIPTAINQGFIALKATRQVSTCFLLEWCRSRLPEIRGRASGTTFPEISKQNFRQINMCLPCQDVMKAFTETVEPLLQRVGAAESEASTLASLRDALLPKLISGELRVPASLGSMQEVAT